MPRHDSPAALSLEGIAVTVPRRTILDIPALTLQRGEVLAVVGPNGAGKSTLLEVAALLRRPAHGEVFINDQRVTRRNALALRRQIAMVFQAPLLLDTSVLANAAAGLRFRGVPRSRAEATAREWLIRFEVDGLARRSPRGLSGGEAKRVSLARAFAVAPALLLLDEPFTALDAASRAAIIPDARAQLEATGAAAIVVTHDLDEAMALGDRLAILVGGRILQDAPPLEVIARPATLAVARLLGIHCLLPARVTERRDDLLHVSVGNQSLTLPAAGAVNSRVNDSVALVIHPGRVALGRPPDPAPPGWHALRGTVARVTPTAAGMTVHVELDRGVTITAHVAPGCAAPFDSGSAVSARFPADAIHLIGVEADGCAGNA
ncbi:MAG: ABC transporter ATP-binding protein [Chloroflexia bacterium]|nr:ABC transporter ATP-binding protein [Chloroflexia bacterium]